MFSFFFWPSEFYNHSNHATKSTKIQNYENKTYNTKSVPVLVLPQTRYQAQNNQRVDGTQEQSVTAEEEGVKPLPPHGDLELPHPPGRVTGS